MNPDYKPKIDTTDLCSYSKKAQYWKRISEMQWAISLGWIDIIYATIVLSPYRPTPRKDHLAKMQKLFGYLNKYTSTSIKINTDMPAYENLKTIEEKWGNLYAVEPEDLYHL